MVKKVHVSRKEKIAAFYLNLMSPNVGKVSQVTAAFWHGLTGDV